MKKENELNKTVKINDVAELAGVSITTVSRVLNGSDKVSPKTMKRVQKAIDELNYVPNEMARGLVTKSNKIIGVLIPDIYNGFYAELITYMEPLLTARGYSLQLCITNAEQEKIAWYAEDLMRRQAAGLIILSSELKDHKLVQRLKANMALLSIEGVIDGVNRVYVESKKGIYTAVENLISLGHQRIAFVGYDLGKDGLKSLQDRLEGYREALEDHGLQPRQEYVVDEGHSLNPGYEGTRYLLQLPEPPTAIQCMNEYCAHGVYQALIEQGVKIPEDMSVSAFDGLQSMMVLNPRLTTAAMPIREMAKTAVEMIVQSILEQNGGIVHTVSFPVELRQGQSVKKTNK